MPLTPDELLSAVSRWVYEYGRRMAARYRLPDADAFVQDCFERLVRFAHLYDPAKGKLTTWVGVVVERMAIAESQRRPRSCLSLDVPWHRGNGDPLTLVELLAAPPPPPDSALDTTEADALRAAIHRLLPGRTGELIALRFGLTDGVEWLTPDLAERFNISRQRVSQVLHDALAQLRTDPVLRVALGLPLATVATPSAPPSPRPTHRSRHVRDHSTISAPRVAQPTAC